MRDQAAAMDIPRGVSTAIMMNPNYREALLREAQADVRLIDHL